MLCTNDTVIIVDIAVVWQKECDSLECWDHTENINTMHLGKYSTPEALKCVARCTIWK